MLKHRLPYHFGQDMLPNMVLPKDLGLRLRLSDQVCNPHCLALTVLDEHVDVLGHLLRRRAILQDALFMVLKHSHNFHETVLVLLVFLHQPGDDVLVLSFNTVCCLTCSTISATAF